VVDMGDDAEVAQAVLGDGHGVAVYRACRRPSPPRPSIPGSAGGARCVRRTFDRSGRLVTETDSSRHRRDHGRTADLV